MIIRTKRLVLRPFQTSDKDWYFEIVQNEDLKRWLPNLATTSYEEAAECVDILAKGSTRNYYYVIEDKHKKAMGIIIAMRISSHTIDVAYFLQEEYRRNGFMTEALTEFMEKVKRQDFLTRFRFVIDFDNTSSLNVVKRIDADITIHKGKYLCYC